ncbi:MAG TPA: mucoidy inhibitor MuiA family protein [Vulgatibacter sp.]
MSSRLPAAILLLLPSLAIADMRVPSTVDEVTVYSASALVTRRAKATLPAGEVRLLLEGLTPRLVDDSVRVETSGSARVRILGISVEDQPLAESTSAPLRAAEAALRDLEDRDRELVDDSAAAGKKRDFLDALRATYAKERSGNLSGNPRELASMVDFMGKEYASIAREIRRIDADRRALAPKIEAARAEVSNLRSTGARAQKRVAIDLAVAKEGTLALALGYRVPNASWRPEWDARLDPGTGKVELGLQAVVEQRTGEDWSGVKLAVSTARPERRVVLGELEPLYLRKAVPMRGGRSAPAPSMKQVGSMREESYAAADMAEVAPARVDVGLVATTLTATSRASVPSTGDARKSPLGVFALESKLARTASPVLDERAFLVAEAVNGTGMPLFAGSVELFVGGAYAGRSLLPDVPPGGDVKLAFGPDPRIRLDRKVLDRSRDESGLFSKTETIRYRTRTTVKNHHDVVVELLLRDLVPVSQDEDISVKLLDGTTAPEQEEDPMKPGVKSWKLKLAPGEERVVELRYAVSYPKGQRIDGLP